MVFRIEEGQVNGVDLSGITVIYNGDILYPKFADFTKHGSEGGIYISDHATEDQRKVLDTLTTTHMGTLFMKKNFGGKYVKIDVGEENGTIHFRTPFGKKTVPGERIGWRTYTDRELHYSGSQRLETLPHVFLDLQGSREAFRIQGSSRIVGQLRV